MGEYDLSKLGDKALVELAVSENSQAAFTELHNRYKARTIAFVSRFVQDKEEAEDICMVSFEKAFKQLSRFNPENKFSTWLFTIARNTALDQKDKASARPQKAEPSKTGTSGPSAMDLVDDNRSPEEEIIRSQDHEHLLDCIEKLPGHYRIVAKMCFMDNMGYKEVAEKAEIPVNTVKTRVARSKVLLMRMMQDMED